LYRRAALDAPIQRPRKHPYPPDTRASCVLASRRPSHPGGEASFRNEFFDAGRIVPDVSENATTQGHLLFVWSPTGYRLLEREGEPPAPGSEVDLDGQRERVTKIGASPLPGDSRPCAYLIG